MGNKENGGQKKEKKWEKMKRRTNQGKWRGNKDNGKLTLGEWEGKTN